MRDAQHPPEDHGQEARVSAPHVYGPPTPEAQAHIDEIGAYIAHDSLDAALKVYDAFEEAFGLLDL